MQLSLPLIPPSEQASTQRQIRSWSIFDQSHIDWKRVTYLRGGAQWRGKRVCLHHLSPGGHHIHTPCTDACAGETLCFCSHTFLSAPATLLCLLSAAAASIPSPNAWREPCGTSEAGLGGLHTSSDARPIWLARHWQEPSHESRWLTCGRIHRDWLPPGGEGLAICHWAERENGIRSEWHKKTALDSNSFCQPPSLGKTGLILYRRFRKTIPLREIIKAISEWSVISFQYYWVVMGLPIG